MRDNFLNVSNSPALTLLETRQVKDLLQLLDAAFGPTTQQIISEFNIGQQVIAKLPNRVKDLVQSSQPYVEPTSAWQPLTTPQSPNLLFCHDNEAGKKLSEMAESVMVGWPFMQVSSPLDHFIIFYQEAPGLAISEMALADCAAPLLQELETEKDRVATRYSHQLGEKMFNLKAILNFENATRWIAAMRELAPDAFKTTGTRELFIEYTDDSGLRQTVSVGKQDQVRDYLDRYGFNALRENFVAHLRRLGKGEILNRMDAKASGTQTLDDRKNVQDFHKVMLEAAFGNAKWWLALNAGRVRWRGVW